MNFNWLLICTVKYICIDECAKSGEFGHMVIEDIECELAAPVINDSGPAAAKDTNRQSPGLFAKIPSLP